MTNPSMWMVRGERGEMYDLFREKGMVVLGWEQLADIKPGTSRREVIATYAEREPGRKHGNIVAGASQVWRFLNEVQEGDEVITYNPSQRKYSVGRFTGKPVPKKLSNEDKPKLTRAVKWEHEFERDALSVATKNSLGSTLTLFRVPDAAADEVRRALTGKLRPADDDDELVVEIDDDSTAEDLFKENAARAAEFIKDRVSKLDWDEMQELIAGILRAMGYKTRVAKPGADRGADIYASPDGLGFETPRIVVEVKHRSGQMGSKEIRSFLGGRHKDDRGLYVSTGGFSKDARYEADRASIPMMLWELNDVVENLTAYYDQLDSDTRQLVPLKRVYWPG